MSENHARITFAAPDPDARRSAAGVSSPSAAGPYLYLASRTLQAPSMPRSVSALDSKVVTTFPILNEDLGWLNPILTRLGLVAGYRPAGDSPHGAMPAGLLTIPLETPDNAATFSVATPLCDSEGLCRGHLGVIRTQEAPAAGIDIVLEASLSLAARAICERWFRLQHHKHWIVAAAPVAQPSQGVLIALDQRLTVQGMDMRALGSIADRSKEISHTRWEDIFRPVTPLPTLRARTDVPLRLISARDDSLWTAILTGPSLGSGTSLHDALLHARPRLHGLADLMKRETDYPAYIPSLTPGMRRKIEEYVEAHLDTQLSVERLADAAGMSCSHFTRAFRNELKTTPHRYVMWRRLMRAQELIRNGDASLAEVALLTGLSDQSHLCRLFQIHIGEPPSRFRRRHRQANHPL